MTTLRSRLRASGAIAAALVRRAVPAALMGAGLWACAAAPPAPKAHLRVVVERGTVAALPGRPSPQAVVLDLGRDPAPATAAARRRVAELQLRALPDDVPAWLVVVGGSGAEPCGAPRVYGPEPGEILAARAAALTPGEPGSLAEGLGELATRLADAAPGGTVLVAAASEARCGALDPCAAVGRLVADGRALDWVIPGGEGLPLETCLDALAVPAGPPPGIDLVPAAGDVPFRVERLVTPSRPGRATAPASPEVTHRGRAGGADLALPAGPARVVVELEGGEEPVGPIVLEPGVLTRVRILDFPSAGHREVFVDAIAPDVRAAPPGGPWN